MKHQLCRNCGSEVTGNYCAACGQRTNTHRLGWSSLTENFTSTFIGDEAYGLRGINMRKGTVTTWLSILFQPHVSIPEYIAGHRRKYFNPVAILLLLSTFYAIVFSLAGKPPTPLADGSQHLAVWLFYTYIDYSSLHPAADMLLMLPFFALALKTVFRRKAGLRYVEYLYIGIFLSVFEITLMIARLPLQAVLPRNSTFYTLELPTFLFTAFVLWKMFRLSKRSALLRTLLTLILHYVYAVTATILLMSGILTAYYLASPESLKNSTESQKEILVEEGSALNQFIHAVIGLATGEHNADADETDADEAAPERTQGADAEQTDGAADAGVAPHAGESAAEKSEER